MKNEQLICNLKQNYFVGEMRYLMHEPFSADVIVTQPVKYFKWSYEKIDLMQKGYPNFKTKLIEIIGRDLILKLQSERNFLNIVSKS